MYTVKGVWKDLIEKGSFSKVSIPLRGGEELELKLAVASIRRFYDKEKEELVFIYLAKEQDLYCDGFYSRVGDRG